MVCLKLFTGALPKDIFWLGGQINVSVMMAVMGYT